MMNGIFKNLPNIVIAVDTDSTYRGDQGESSSLRETSIQGIFGFL